VPVQTASIATGLRAGTYIGTVTDSKGCTSIVNAIITEPSKLISSIADSVNILCNGDSTGKAVVVASGGVKPYNYSWNTLPVQTSDTGKRLKAGTTIVTVTDGNGCIAQSAVTLTQPTAIILADSVKDVACYNGNDGMIQVYATGGMLPYLYSWNAFPLLKDSIARNLKIGTYIMSVSDSNGCRKTLNITVNQPPDISISFTIEDTSCMYEGKGRATVHARGGTSPYRYFWNTLPTQYDSASYALLPKYYTAAVTDAHNCVKKDSVLIPGYPDVVTKVTPDTILCQGDTITLRITGASFYTWNPNVYINKWYLSTPRVYPDTSIRYVIYAQDSNGCRDTNYVKVTVIYKNKLYVSDSQQICEGGRVQLRAYGGTEYTWQPSESLDDSRKADPFASPSETTVYHVKINQDNCFSEELDEKVVVNKNPVLSLQEYIKAFPGARIPIDPHAQYAVKYEWTPVTGLSCTDCEVPTLEVGTTTQYILKATGVGECSTYDTVMIHSMCDGSVLYMANTFTPNGDGNNDYFYPQGTGVGVIKSFKVMNHWGQVVFEARDIPGNQFGYGWNGKYKGADLPSDVFAYMVEYECADGQIGSVTGDITLIR
jgi:gliding motility-associated-like protein